MSQHTVCALIYDQMPLFEFSIAAELFGLERPEMGPNWYRFTTASLETKPITTTAGLKIISNSGLEAFEEAQSIIICGWPFKTHKPSENLIDALKQSHKKGTRLMSICSGSFLLAEAGLLDGLKATTHWLHADEFRTRYPKVDFEPNVLYVDEGQILTAAGSAAGIDLGLYVIRKDFGTEIVNKIACRLIVPPHRDGGQAQYIRNPVPKAHEGHRLSQLMDEIRQDVDKPYSIVSLSKKAGMSNRTFLRKFEAATGLTPMKWLLEVRLIKACALLENQSYSLDEIASLSGMGSAANLRHHFRNRFNTTPTNYRQTFQRR
jgi:AraC family transcriptional regulator, transcriptional activator FtrA